MGGQEYIEKHAVSEKLKAAVTAALKERPTDPIAFIADFLKP